MLFRTMGELADRNQFAFSFILCPCLKIALSSEFILPKIKSPTAVTKAINDIEKNWEGILGGLDGKDRELIPCF